MCAQSVKVVIGVLLIGNGSVIVSEKSCLKKCAIFPPRRGFMKLSGSSIR
jgi:hypothetical protein